MNVIFISECKKKSAILSRRILSRYARNIARRTWIASITQEGLDHLQQELLQIANKNSAIACHKVTTRNEIELEWLVGSQKQFDQEGNFAFRYTENIAERYQIELSDLSRNTIKLFSYLNKLAGLFHDVGKNFYYFQNKLIHEKKGKESGDPIRHEYLSLIVFISLLDFDKDSFCDQLIAIKNNVDNLNQNELINTIEENDFISSGLDIIQTEDQNLSFIKAISHLIISHHRLVSSPKSLEDYIDYEFYFNHYNELNTLEKNKIFQLYQQQKFILFNKEWKNKLNSIIKSLTTLYSDSKAELDLIIKDQNLLMPIVNYILRPALIMADQYISGQRSNDKTVAKIEENKKNYTDNNAIANFKQSLGEHLGWVAQQAFANNKVLFQSILSNKRLYTIETPKKLLKPVAKSLSQFLWQQVAVDVVKNIDCIEKQNHFGFFAVVMAKTGAGKTQANAKIMAALSTEMRFSTLLGLRTLTLQTLDEYRNNLGIDKNNIIGIIGDQTTRLLHELGQEDSKNEQKHQEETSTLKDLFKDEAEIKISANFFKDVDTPFPPELCFNHNNKDAKLDVISKIPILVATIDYMLNGIDAGRSSKTRFLTRLMTSDIIIDEIDSYNQNDLMAIHKLVYLTGFYGKKLIISSATVPESLINSFYLAYSTGYQRFQIYADKKNSKIYMGLFTHIDSLNQVSPIEKNEKIIIKQFVDTFYSAIKEEKVKRRASVLDISQFLHQDLKKKDSQHKELAPLYQTMVQQYEQLHQLNHTLIDGVEISTGLVKFNNTVDAFNFSHYLFDASDLEKNSLVKIECYHARHFPVRRNYTEEVLKTLLNRKKESNFKQHPLVKNALKEAKNKGKKRIILLVVSTTIIEIGRDFDFDWGIIEPSSHWSIVQTVGRIMRHREKERSDNVVLLSHSMKAVRYAQNKNKIYTLPGPETNDFCLDENDKYKSVEDLFEYEALSQKIDASITLKNTQGNPIKNLENRQIESFIINKEAGSFQSYLHQPLEYLSTFNQDKNPFRGEYKKQYIYQQDEFSGWNLIDKKKGEKFPVVHFILVELAYPKRCLLDKSLEEIEEEYAKKGINLDREIYSLVESKKDKKYNEFLGVL